MSDPDAPRGPDDADARDDEDEDAGLDGAARERRRARQAERSGTVDLGGAMSDWPVPDPPTQPRPVVRPARPSQPGVATAPVLPTPSAVVLEPLLRARAASAPSDGPAGARRSRRRGASGDDATTPAWSPATTVTPGAATGSRRSTRRVGALVLAGLLLLVAAVLVVVLPRSGQDGDGPAPGAAPSEAPAQQTLALSLADVSGRAVAAAVLGVDDARLATLLVPADLLLTVADAGSSLTVTQAAELGAQPLRRGLEDTLTLRVDGAVRLYPEQIATLVEGMGGVEVDVDQEVLTDEVALGVGDDQLLSGPQAVAYLELGVDGEPVEARLARAGQVLDGLVAGLPTEGPGVVEALRTAGVPVEAGLDAEAAGDLLARAAQRAGEDAGQAVVLPTTLLGVDGAERRGLDDAAARTELDRRFAGARLPVSEVGEVRVLVRNGVGTPGLVGRARDLLVADGLRFAAGGNADAFGRTSTVVLVASQDTADRDAGEAVAAALGLDGSALQVNSESMVDVDVVVVLGEDFAAQSDTTTPSTDTPSGETP